MTKEELKPFIIPVLYVIIITTLIATIFFLQRTLEKEEEANQSGFVYGEDILAKDTTPVVGDNNAAGEELIMKPYIDEGVKPVKYFYDYQADKEKQQSSLIFHEDTYIQNSGVDYSGATIFDVVSVLSGTVTNVDDDALLGKIIEIKHNNELVTLYQSLSEVAVKKGDTVTKGQVIGKSGTSNIDKELKDHLHFEIYYNGQVVDPEKFIGKNITELDKN